MNRHTSLGLTILVSLLAACNADSSQPVADDGVYSGWIPGPSGDYIQVRYEMRDGLAILDGDILLTHVLDQAPPKHQRSAVVKNGNWPGGVVPYEIGAGFDATRTARIQAAIKDWNDNTPFNWRERNGETDYVRFVDSDQCFSAIGRTGGMQDILLGTGCGTTETIHEMGHAVGLFHEQARQDRDNFVTIDFTNVQDAKKFNFDKYDPASGEDVGPYDITSIMHYPALITDATFVKDITKNTITQTDGTTFVTSGVLSNLDRASAYRRADVTDLLRDKWLENQDILGFATDSPQRQLVGFGRWLPTQFGRVYEKPNLGHSVIVYGDILAHYVELGAETSNLGRPVSDEKDMGDEFGRVSNFEHGSIYWTPVTGAHVLLSDPIREHWLSMGAGQSLLGYLVSDEKLFDDGTRTARFQRGTITWTLLSGITVKHDAVVEVPGTGLPGIPLCTFLIEGC